MGVTKRPRFWKKGSKNQKSCNPSSEASTAETKDPKKKSAEHRNDGGSREQPQSTAPMSEKKSEKKQKKGSSKQYKKTSKNAHKAGELSVDGPDARKERANQLMKGLADNHGTPPETLQTPPGHQNNIKTSREENPRTMKSPTCVKVPVTNHKDVANAETTSNKVKGSKMLAVTPARDTERSQKLKVNSHVPNSTLTPNSTLSTTDKWFGEETAKAWLEKAEFIKMKAEFEKLQTMTVNVEMECKKWKSNGKLNQSMDDFPALDANLVTFENVYVNMNLVHVPLQRDIYLGQIPVKGNEESFWKVVFDRKTTFIDIITEQESIDFFPKRSGDHVYHGTMFVNNRRVETVSEDVHRFLIEVLPEGCSNSIICNITVIKNWYRDGVPRKKALVVKEVNEMLNFLEITKDETALVISKHGAGRAGFFAAFSVAMHLMNKGSEPSMYDIVKSVRSQRPKSVNSLPQYTSLYTLLFYYIKKKLVKGDGPKKVVSHPSDAACQKAVQLAEHFDKALIAETEKGGGKSTMTILK